MDIWEDFKTFARERNRNPKKVLSDIVSIRAYRNKENLPSKRKPISSRFYEKFIRSIPCLGCKIEHVIPRYLNDSGCVVSVGSSYSCVPLCRKCVKNESVVLNIQFRYRDIQYKLMSLYLRCMEGV